MFVIFSDLDKCLLDNNYRFDRVKSTLDKLLNQNHHLIFNSSKTRAEVRLLLKEMGITIPFIVENGSAIFIPKDYLTKKPQLPDRDGYLYLELGKRYDQIKKGMEVVVKQIGPVDSFSSLSVDDLVHITGLDKDKARLAKEREYSEPFIYRQVLPEDLAPSLGQLGLKILRGRSFCHLIGPTDKGVACTRMIQIMEDCGLSFVSVGIGDGPNDLPMLESVDIAFLTQLGPEGWENFVTKLLEMNHG